MAAPDPKVGSTRRVEDGVATYHRTVQGRKAGSKLGPRLSEAQIAGTEPITEADLSKTLGNVSLRNINKGKTMGARKRQTYMSPRGLDTMLKRAKALELRRAGFTWQEIANRKSLGYTSARNAQRDVHRLLQQLIDTPAQEVLAVELSRLDAVTQALWQNVRNGDLASIDRIMNAMRMRQELLGLHRINVQHQIVTTDDMDREIARLTQEMSKFDDRARDQGGTSISDQEELERARKEAGL